MSLLSELNGNLDWLDGCTEEIQPVYPKGDQSWVFIGGTDVEAETLILWPPHAESWLIWKDSNAGKKLRAGGGGDNRGWDGWMASPTRWTWVWVDSGSWWWTGRPGVPQFMGSQRVGHNWATELNWTEQKRLEDCEINIYSFFKTFKLCSLLISLGQHFTQN